MTTWFGVCRIVLPLPYDTGRTDPTTPRVMHRSYKVKSSGPSCGPFPHVPRTMRLLCASAVSGGIFPSDGSTMSEVMRNVVSPRHALSRPDVFGLDAARAFWRVFSSRATRSAYSASVRNARPANCSGRSRGTPCTLSLVQDPWRSGWPQEVRGGVQLFATPIGARLVRTNSWCRPIVQPAEAPDVVPDGPWPLSGTNASQATPAIPATPAIRDKRHLRILPSALLFRSFIGRASARRSDKHLAPVGKRHVTPVRPQLAAFGLKSFDQDLRARKQ